VFAAELLLCAIIVFGTGWAVLRGNVHDLWPGALFCFSFVLAVIVDNIIKRILLKRRPFFGAVFSVVLVILFLAAGIGLAIVSSL